MRPALVVLSVTAAAALCAIGSEARADPQGTGAITIGVAGRGDRGAFWDDTVFHLGARGDVLFGRERNADFGAGPYLELCSHAFDDIQLGAGLSVLLPVIDYLPIVLSGGGYARAGDNTSGLEPGVAAALFWGSRSYNFHSSYVMSAGLLAELRVGLGDSRERSIVIGAQLDLLAISLPFLYVVNAVRGGSPDTAPVR